MSRASDPSGEIAALLLKSEFPPPLLGGARVYYHELLRRQLEGRFVVLTATGDGDDGAFDARQSYQVVRRDYLRRDAIHGYSGFVRANLRLFVDTWRILRKTRGILLFGQMDWTALFGLTLVRVTGSPFVMFLHGEDLTRLERRRTLWSGAQRAVTRAAFRRAGAIVVNTWFTWEKAVAFGAPAGSITLVYPGVDVERFQPKPGKDAPGSPPRLLSVGRLFERKGMDTVIAALPELRGRFPGLRYEIVGNGPDRVRLERRARESGVADAVDFLGAVSEEELPDVYRRADVFVLPNRELQNADTEGFGIVFLEAAASGVPAVAGRAGGTGEAVVDGDTGFRVDPGSSGAVAEVVSRLLSDEALWRGVRRRARERAEREFSWDRGAALLGDVLRRIWRE